MLDSSQVLPLLAQSRELLVKLAAQDVLSHQAREEAAEAAARIAVTIENYQRDQAHAAGDFEDAIQFFGYAQLPPHLQGYSRPFGEMANWIMATLPSNRQRQLALETLVQVKDYAVRARVWKHPEAR